MIPEELEQGAKAGAKLMEYGVLGAILLLLLLFMGVLVFRYWLPMTNRLQLERERLQAEVQKARDQNNTDHVNQLTALLEQRDKVHHEREIQMRREHGENWEKVRVWQAQESQREREHSTKLVENFCTRMEQMEEALNRCFALNVVVAEHAGHDRGALLERVGAITGKEVKQDNYKRRA
jgi:uncharacterized membrane protein YhiD involved in acid resistance